MYALESLIICSFLRGLSVRDAPTSRVEDPADATAQAAPTVGAPTRQALARMHYDRPPTHQFAFQRPWAAQVPSHEPGES